MANKDRDKAGGLIFGYSIKTQEEDPHVHYPILTRLGKFLDYLGVPYLKKTRKEGKFEGFEFLDWSEVDTDCLVAMMGLEHKTNYNFDANQNEVQHRIGTGDNKQDYASSKTLHRCEWTVNFEQQNVAHIDFCEQVYKDLEKINDGSLIKCLDERTFFDNCKRSVEKTCSNLGYGPLLSSKVTYDQKAGENKKVMRTMRIYLDLLYVDLMERESSDSFGFSCYKLDKNRPSGPAPRPQPHCRHRRDTSNYDNDTEQNVPSSSNLEYQTLGFIIGGCVLFSSAVAAVVLVQKVYPKLEKSLKLAFKPGNCRRVRKNLKMIFRTNARHFQQKYENQRFALSEAFYAEVDNDTFENVNLDLPVTTCISIPVSPANSVHDEDELLYHQKETSLCMSSKPIQRLQGNISPRCSLNYGRPSLTRGSGSGRGSSKRIANINQIRLNQKP